MQYHTVQLNKEWDDDDGEYKVLLKVSFCGHKEIEIGEVKAIDPKTGENVYDKVPKDLLEDWLDEAYYEYAGCINDGDW